MNKSKKPAKVTKTAGLSQKQIEANHIYQLPIVQDPDGRHARTRRGCPEGYRHGLQLSSGNEISLLLAVPRGNRQ